MTLPVEAKARKAIPLATGCFDYFPDALAAVAEVSRQGNDQHNPGEPLHWSRNKSNDHADCAARHLLERGKFDDGHRHSAKLAWRALALLQIEIEEEAEAVALLVSKMPAPASVEPKSKWVAADKAVWQVRAFESADGVVRGTD